MPSGAPTRCGRNRTRPPRDWRAPAGRESVRNALDPTVNPSVENRKLAFGDFFSETLEDMITTNVEIYKKINDDPNFGALFREFMYTKLASALNRANEART